MPCKCGKLSSSSMSLPKASKGRTLNHPVQVNRCHHVQAYNLPRCLPRHPGWYEPISVSLPIAPSMYRTRPWSNASPFLALLPGNADGSGQTHQHVHRLSPPGPSRATAAGGASTPAAFAAPRTRHPTPALLHLNSSSTPGRICEQHIDSAGDGGWSPLSLHTAI